MTAVYRNHQFDASAYGNYLGLGSLLGFVDAKQLASRGTDVRLIACGPPRSAMARVLGLGCPLNLWWLLQSRPLAESPEGK